uniref:Secreted protein n=1 Tax=Coccidioides posadasii RMSCC 3488 TaxID=454284 RepID=A0A0J6FMW6_COCPO|nr:hypothetical protein CPAG_08014 [Coccidioides posadasii RMSCC 3488]
MRHAGPGWLGWLGLPFCWLAGGRSGRRLWLVPQQRSRNRAKKSVCTFFVDIELCKEYSAVTASVNRLMSYEWPAPPHWLSKAANLTGPNAPRAPCIRSTPNPLAVHAAPILLFPSFLQPPRSEFSFCCITCLPPPPTTTTSAARCNHRLALEPL